MVIRISLKVGKLYVHTKAERTKGSAVHNIRIYYDCGNGIEKNVLRDDHLHHKACKAMTNGDWRDIFFYPILTLIIAHH